MPPGIVVHKVAWHQVKAHREATTLMATGDEGWEAELATSPGSPKAPIEPRYGCVEDLVAEYLALLLKSAPPAHRMVRQLVGPSRGGPAAQCSVAHLGGPGPRAGPRYVELVDASFRHPLLDAERGRSPRVPAANIKRAGPGRCRSRTAKTLEIGIFAPSALTNRTMTERTASGSAKAS